MYHYELYLLRRLRSGLFWTYSDWNHTSGTIGSYEVMTT